MRRSFFLITFMLIALWPSLAGCAAGSSLKQPARREAATPPTRDLGSVPMYRDAGSPSTPPVGMDSGRAELDSGSALLDAGRAAIDAGRPAPPPPPPPPPPARETCNGLDDDGDGSTDEDFLCPLGRIGERCVTSCGAIGERHCEAPACSWSSFCYPMDEQCDTIDNDCDGLVDEGCASAPPPVVSQLMRIRLADPRIGACPGGWKIRLWLAYPAEESAPGATLERSVIRYDGWSSISLWCDGRSPEWFVWGPLDWTALDTDMFAELSLGGVDLRSSVRLCEDPLSAGGGIRPIIMWDAARRSSCPP